MRCCAKQVLRSTLVRAAPGALLGLACVLILLAQSPRDSYHAAYAVWRQADPNLERDAASPQPGFAERVEKVAQAAAAYGKARASFLRSSARQDLGPLAEPFKPELELLPNRDLQAFVASETKSVEANIKRFENDRDPGIVQWRQALERERAALANLGTATVDRQTATAKAATPMAAAEVSRVEVVARYSQFNTALVQASDIMGLEATAWAEYYHTLSMVGSPVTPTRITGGPSASQNVPPIPLIRYTGTWSFPAATGIFTGAKPEFVDLAVHEEGGQLNGSFYGRFTLPPGAKTDPVLRFDFSGALSAARTQSLTLETAEGAKGVIELIPGGAFNLLEVNFHTDPKPGKLQQGNMVLLKK
jgi:hypothetical protein